MTRYLSAEATFEDIDDWFKIGKAKPSRPKIIEASATGADGLLGVLRSEKYEESARRTHARQGISTRPKPAPTSTSQKAYAEPYKRQWEQDQLEDDMSMAGGDNDHPIPSAMSDLESMSVFSGQQAVMPNEVSPEVAIMAYNNYNFDHKYNEELPITRHKDQVLNTIESNQVTIIQGSTGCGKTTQVPQYILDDYVSRRKHCNIVVTQPRKIAAISIARRVCEERRWQLGSLVGYRVGMDKCTSEDTRLTYMTTGVLLQKLINQKNMTEFTHVILDEVHERDQDTDFAMLVVRKMQKSNSRHVKVILMSATIDVSLFGKYFALPVRGTLEMPPVVSVEGHVYDVEEKYLDDLLKFGMVPRQRPDQHPAIEKETYELARNLVCYFDELERQEQGLPPGALVQQRGTVLAFLPGINEIEEFEKMLPGQGSKERMVVIPLHSSITTQEQSRAFIKPEEGFRKVILSTNIAESSITVPDIKYVIDFMLLKCLVCDVDTNFQSLQLNWASKANAEQRKGRAGRVAAGRVFRLVYRGFYEDYIDEFVIPEMLRCPLEQLILKVKVLDQGEPKAVLGLALEPPNLDNIERTILLLKEVGALTTLHSQVPNPHDGDLTFVGKVLSSLPVDIRIGKLLVLGHVFGCLKECLIIGAGLSLKSFFSQPFKRGLEAYKSKLKWDDGSFSDSIAILHAYREWEKLKENGYFARGRRVEREWAHEQMIQLNTLREVSKLVAELEDRLNNHNIRLPRGHPGHQPRLDPNEQWLILKVVLAGAFYPNYFTWVPSDEAESLKMLSGKDPCTTVMVKNVPSHGPMYSNSIRKLFLPCGKPKNFFFEGNKMFIQFEREGDSSSILPGVYHAVKMRQLRTKLELDTYEVERESKAEALKKEEPGWQKPLATSRVAVSMDSKGPQPVSLPSPSMEWVSIVPTEVIDGCHFWAQYYSKEALAALKQIADLGNDRGQGELESLRLNELQVGDLVLAPFWDEGTTLYYRARILNIKKTAQGGQLDVFFVDYGNKDTIHEKHIRFLPPELMNIEFQAFECALVNLKPFYKLPQNQWLPKAVQRLRQLILYQPLHAKVFSVVDGVVRLDLYDTGRDPEVHIQEVMIEEQMAEQAEEAHISKINHLQREMQREEGIRLDEQLGDGWMHVNAEEQGQPQLKKKGKVFLQGPHSPYEINFAGMTRVGRSKTTRVDRTSVNSVSLCTEPEDKHEKMMVSAHVGLNPSGSVLQARNTTLMPNIQDLPALVCMIFAPTIELRTDKHRSRLTGVLCGLGWDPETELPMLPDHDIELAFDTKIKSNDISIINGLRYAINLIVSHKDHVAQLGAVGARKVQQEARATLIRLLTTKRAPVERKHYHLPYAWDQLDEDTICPVEKGGIVDSTFPMLFQLHNTVYLEASEDNDYDEEYRKKKAHLDDLHERASKSVVRFPTPIVCMLCNIACYSPRDLFFHLTKSTKHQEEVSRLEPPPLV